MKPIQSEIEELKKAAENGDAEAQAQLGKKYYHADGVKNNYNIAAHWFIKAARQDHPLAKFYLGNLLLFENSFLEEDPEKALELFRDAEEQGIEDASGFIGYMYCLGWIVDKNREEGMSRLLKAADNGKDWAMYLIGDVYFQDFFDNFGVAEETAEEAAKEAVKWFTKAAESGSPQAMRKLGEMYDHAFGARGNPDEAERWYRKAGEQGDSIALFELSEALYNGFDGLCPNRIDHLESYRLLRESAYLGYKVAKEVLWDCYGERVPEENEENEDYEDDFWNVLTKYSDNENLYNYMQENDDI